MAKLLEYAPYRQGAHAMFTSSENGCKHIGKNNDRNNVRQFQVDGGIFSKDDNCTRCDYLLLNDDKETAYYIELKGSDINKAISQIENTISMLHREIVNYAIYRRIVYRTGSHDVRGPQVLRWKKKYGSSIRIESREMTDSI